MNLKLIIEQVLKLVKAYRAGKRGQKQVAGVANLFGGLVGQLDAGINELEDARMSLVIASTSLRSRWTKLMARLLMLRIFARNLRSLQANAETHMETFRIIYSGIQSLCLPLLRSIHLRYQAHCGS